MILTHLRHTIREEPHPHITQKGLDLAKKVGKKFETCVAMGHAVHGTIDFSTATKGINKPQTNMPEGTPFTKYLDEYFHGSFILDFGKNCKNLIVEKIRSFNKSDVKRILVVSHAGVIESSTIAFNPSIDYLRFGAGVSHCEGVILTLTKDFQWVDGKVFRSGSK